MIATLCKSFTFDAAHQLVGHKGKCQNLHGHTYKLEVFITGEVNRDYGSSDEGFVVDFSEVKEIVKREIVDPMDHAFLVCGNEPALDKVLTKKYYLGFRSTCENMAGYILYKLSRVWPPHLPPVTKIRLWETPTGYAEVSLEGHDLDQIVREMVGGAE